MDGTTQIGIRAVFALIILLVAMVTLIWKIWRAMESERLRDEIEISAESKTSNNTVTQQL